jgi:hypothetical protein
LVGNGVGDLEGDSVAEVGEVVGFKVAPSVVGLEVGTCVGSVGVFVGDLVGLRVGLTVGESVNKVGEEVGFLESPVLLGDIVGVVVATVGVAVGLNDGRVGALVGLEVCGDGDIVGALD